MKSTFVHSPKSSSAVMLQDLSRLKPTVMVHERSGMMNKVNDDLDVKMNFATHLKQSRSFAQSKNASKPRTTVCGQ
jgi:hypothetical protein